MQIRFLLSLTLVSCLGLVSANTSTVGSGSLVARARAGEARTVASNTSGNLERRIRIFTNANSNYFAREAAGSSYTNKRSIASEIQKILDKLKMHPLSISPSDFEKRDSLLDELQKLLQEFGNRLNDRDLDVHARADDALGRSKCSECGETDLEKRNFKSDIQNIINEIQNLKFPVSAQKRDDYHAAPQKDDEDFVEMLSVLGDIAAYMDSMVDGDTNTPVNKTLSLAKKEFTTGRDRKRYSAKFSRRLCSITAAATEECVDYKY